MIAWFPAALLEDYVSFEKVADNGANDAVDVTFTHRGRSVTGRLYVDFVAERYRSVDGGGSGPLAGFPCPLTWAGRISRKQRGWCSSFSSRLTACCALFVVSLDLSSSPVDPTSTVPERPILGIIRAPVPPRSFPGQPGGSDRGSGPLQADSQAGWRPPLRALSLSWGPLARQTIRQAAPVDA